MRSRSLLALSLGASALCALLACDGQDVRDAGLPDAGPPDAGPLAPSVPAPEPLIDLVDPFLGTGGSHFNDLGSAYPGPQRPFGMVRPGPDTSAEGGAPGFTHCSGFAYDDDFIVGFSHARMHGTGIADYGNVALMPIAAMQPSYVTQAGYRSTFDRASMEASPGYYAVTLERDDVRVELTSSDRVAVHRYTFAEGAPQAVLVDLGHAASTDIEVVDSAIAIDPATRELSGYAQVSGGYSGRFGGVRVYFAARFDRDFTEHGTFQGAEVREESTSASAPRSGGWVSFDPEEGRTVHVEVGLSFVDVEGARANLIAESEGFDFDAVRAESESIWEEWLSRIRIHARSETDFRRFYTALYHALLMPTLAHDVDGRYRGIDGEVHTAEGFRYSTDFSLWDTFRTLHPLLTLAYPSVQRDMLRSLTQMAVDGGAMPRWPLGHGYTGGMVGEPAAITFADSWVKGVQDVELRAAYDAMRRGAFGRASELFEGRGNAEVYDRLGYVPIESGGGSTSETLEFAYADWALAILADALGETEDAARFRERAGYFQNAWDPARGFFVGRHEDGRFVDSFVEDRWQSFFTEGNARQYVWYAPHDPEGLAELMGGRDALLARLTEFFEESRRERRTVGPPEWYWHGNEPDLHASFLFAQLGDFASSARWSRWVAQTFYGDGPEGLAGNDDGGTLSAWLVFATMGIFAIAGEDHYLIGSPIATRTELAVEGGTFVIEAPEASDRAPVVAAATFDGGEGLVPLSLPHAAIQAGATLRLEMTGP